MSIEELLAHSDFVQALARSLVQDEHRAADISQDTWMRALKRPPAEERSIRAWLSKVVRNINLNTQRSESRRKERERTSIEPGKTLPPDEIVARGEARRHLIEAVLGLQDPFRTTILLRFYENMSINEIAEHDVVPTGTVKSRLKRGLDQLRLRLDGQHGGSREKWITALVPLAGLKLSASAVGSVGTAATSYNLITGAFIVSTKVKIGILTAFVILTAVAVHQLLLNNQDEPLPMSSMNGGAEVADDAVAQPAVQVDDPVAQVDDEISATKSPLLPAGTFISGRVVDKVTKEAIPVYSFSLYQEEEGGLGKNVVSTTVRHETGAFHFSLERAGIYTLWIETSNYLRKDIASVEVPAEGLVELLVELDPGICLRGRVVEDATGYPVKGAIIVPIPERTMFLESLKILLLNPNALVTHARTDEDGWFTLGALDSSLDSISASHPEFTAATSEIDTSRETVIRLKKGYRIYGNAYDDEGRPIEGVLITMAGKSTPVPRPVLTGEDGSYLTPPVRPDRLCLRAELPPKEDDKRKVFTPEVKIIKLKDRDLVVNFGPSSDQVTWRGVLFDEQDKPVTKGKVDIAPTTLTLGEAYQFRARREVSCNQQGGFEFQKLECGSYDVSLFYAQGKHKTWGEIRFESPGVVERDIHLAEALIRGVVVNAWTGKAITGKAGWVTALDIIRQTKSNSCSIDKEGRFNFTHLSPGSYRLYVSIDDYTNHKEVPGLRVKEGERIDDLCIPVEPGGKVCLKVLGFSEADPRQFIVYYHKQDGQKIAYTLRPKEEKGQHTRQLTLTFEAGLWNIYLALDDDGYIDRPIEVKPGETTTVVIHRDEFISEERRVNIIGSLIRTDRSPVVEADIGMADSRQFVWGSKKQEPYKKMKSDSTGRFEAQDLRPGKWSVWVTLPDGCRINYADQIIPHDAVSPYSMDFVLPESQVTGTLYDGLTNEPLGSQGTVWRATLKNVKINRHVCTLPREKRVDTVRFTAVPEGRYVLTLQIRGYWNFTSQPFDVMRGQTTDLGCIDLIQCGSMILKVVDEAGDAVDSFRLFCNEREITSFIREEIESGVYFYNNLPLEPVIISILADGYRESEIKVQLEPAQPLEQQVVLKSL